MSVMRMLPDGSKDVIYTDVKKSSYLIRKRFTGFMSEILRFILVKMLLCAVLQLTTLEKVIGRT